MNVSQIQTTLATFIDGVATAPTEGTTDWAFRLDLINRSQLDWASAYDWPQLYKEVNSRTSQATGQASIALPQDFAKLATKFVENTGTVTNEYPEVEPQERSRYATTDKFAYVLGNGISSTLVVNPGSFSSGASIFYGYWANPGSLASGSMTSVVPDPNYIIQRTLAYYWQSKSDARFQDARVEADKLLGRMLEKVNTLGYGYRGTTRSQDEAFRWGE